MVDEPNGSRWGELARLFPAVRLLQCVGVSLHLRLLYLAALGLLLLFAGWHWLDTLIRIDRPLTSRAGSVWGPVLPIVADSYGGFLKQAPWRLSEPVRLVVAPFLGVFSTRERGGSWLYMLLAAAWGATVWGTIGGAIARIATVRVTTGGRVGMGSALRFALGKFIPLVGGPLTPLVGVALFAAFCAAFGTLYRMPSGSLIAGALLVLPLLAALVMATILTGLAAGWPLVHAAVAAEGEDGFDALSRSYAYVFQRPGRYVAYVLISGIVGIAGLVFVDLFSRAVVHLAVWGLSFSAPADVLASNFSPGTLRSDSSAASAHRFWLSAVGLLAQAWIYAYFWTSASVIYLLLRRDVDGTDFHRVFLPPERRSGAAEPESAERDPTLTTAE